MKLSGYITLQELAQASGRSEKTVRKAIHEGRLPQPEIVFQRYVWPADQAPLLIAAIRREELQAVATMA